MRACAWIIATLALAAPAEHALAQARRAQPYEGLWGASRAACRDEDGVDRMEITANRFYWYETRCRAHDITADGPRSWRIRMSCEGEGQRYSARPRVTLAARDRLVMSASPVGPTKRQVYVRCAGLR